LNRQFKIFHRGKATCPFILSAHFFEGFCGMAAISTSPTPLAQTADDLTPPTPRFFQRYSVRILLQGLFTIWAVLTFTFVLIRQMPGNPIEIKIEQLMQQQNLPYDQARQQAAGLLPYDFEAPILQQYLEFMGNLLRGDLGKSITGAGTPVIDQIARFLPWTLFSVGSALCISFLLGVTIGLAMGYWRGGLLDNVFTIFASVIAGIPDYIIALLIVLILGVQLELFNIGEFRGGVDPNITPGFTLEYIGSLIKYASLMIAVYVLATVGTWILTMKSSTISTLGEDYITVAKARGLPEWRVLTAYVGRNAMLPLVTRLAISIGFVVGGSVVIEELFQYPGLGRALLKAIVGRDYTTMQGIFLILSVSVVFSNILSDLALGWLDPRVRLHKRGDV
jgi:peptide/nickel transport system permease protein